MTPAILTDVTILAYSFATFGRDSRPAQQQNYFRKEETFEMATATSVLDAKLSRSPGKIGMLAGFLFWGFRNII